MKSFTKDPGAVLDYLVDWSEWLGTDLISSSSWVVQSPLTTTNSTNTTTTATVWLSGGVSGQQYVVTNRIVTAGARTNERSFMIMCQDL